MLLKAFQLMFAPCSLLKLLGQLSAACEWAIFGEFSHSSDVNRILTLFFLTILSLLAVFFFLKIQTFLKISSLYLAHVSYLYPAILFLFFCVSLRIARKKIIALIVYSQCDFYFFNHISSSYDYNLENSVVPIFISSSCKSKKTFSVVWWRWTAQCASKP